MANNSKIDSDRAWKRWRNSGAVENGRADISFKDNFKLPTRKQIRAALMATNPHRKVAQILFPNILDQCSAEMSRVDIMLMITNAVDLFLAQSHTDLHDAVRANTGLYAKAVCGRGNRRLGEVLAYYFDVVRPISARWGEMKISEKLKWSYPYPKGTNPLTEVYSQHYEILEKVRPQLMLTDGPELVATFVRPDPHFVFIDHQPSFFPRMMLKEPLPSPANPSLEEVIKGLMERKITKITTLGDVTSPLTTAREVTEEMKINKDEPGQ